MMAAILDKQQSLFNSFTEQNKCWLNLKYKITSTHKNYQHDENFIFIENTNIQSVDDNWYVVNLDKDVLTVSFLVSYSMQRNIEYLEFLEKRISSLFNSKFISFSIVNLIESYVLPADGYFDYKAKLRSSKQAALVPSFYFWKKNKIQAYINNLFKQKIIKNIESNKKQDVSP